MSPIFSLSFKQCIEPFFAFAGSRFHVVLDYQQKLGTRVKMLSFLFFTSKEKRKGSLSYLISLIHLALQLEDQQFHYYQNTTTVFFCSSCVCK